MIEMSLYGENFSLYVEFCRSSSVLLYERLPLKLLLYNELRQYVRYIQVVHQAGVTLHVVLQFLARVKN